MQKYANHQLRHNHHHHHYQHNLIQWPQFILLQGTLDENSQRWTMKCQFYNYNSEKYINSGNWTQPNPTHFNHENFGPNPTRPNPTHGCTQPTTMSVLVCLSVATTCLKLFLLAPFLDRVSSRTSHQEGVSKNRGGGEIAHGYTRDSIKYLLECC